MLRFFEKHETLGFVSLYVACNIIIYLVYVQGFTKGRIQASYGGESNEELGLVEAKIEDSTAVSRVISKTPYSRVLIVDYADDIDPTCRSLLTTGSWQNFKQAKNGELLHRNGSWAYTGHWHPKNCIMHHYTKHQLHTCIQKFGQNRTISVIGDRRARTLYRVMEARFRGVSTVHDVTIRDVNHNFPFSYYWSQSFHGRPVSTEKPEFSNFIKLGMDIQTRKDQLVIVDEQFLHPTNDMLSYKSNRTTVALIQYLETAIFYFDEFILKRILSKHPELTIVVLATEGSKRIYRDWNQNKWDQVRDFYNEHLEKVVSKYPSVFWMDNNMKTATGPDGVSLLPDGANKMVANEGNEFFTEEIPASLVADVDMIFNLHCNSHFKFSSKQKKLDLGSADELRFMNEKFCCKRHLTGEADKHEIEVLVN